MRTYRIYLPPCYGEDGHTYPTLYLFHGNIHTDNKWDELGIDEAADEGILSGTLPPMLIVLPDGGRIANVTSGGPGSFEDVVLSELIPHIENKYCASPNKDGRAVGGLSRGGYWALEMAFRNPELFNSAGAHSAALIDSGTDPTINPLSSGPNNDLNDLRIYLDIGANDYLIEEVQRLHELLLDAGVTHTWNLNDGQHADTYWADHLAGYLDWYSEPWSGSRESYPSCESPSPLLSLSQMSTANTTMPNSDNMISFINPVAKMAISPKAKLTA
jgi:enterochelin esterase-like enzyme